MRSLWILLALVLALALLVSSWGLGGPGAEPDAGREPISTLDAAPEQARLEGEAGVLREPAEETAIHARVGVSPTPRADAGETETGGGDVVGRVITSDGRPVPGAEVTIARYTFDDADELRDARTDEAGRFRLRSSSGGARDRSEEGGRLLLTAMDVRLGLATAELPRSALDEGADVGSLVLEDGAVLAGLVVDSGGPVAGLRVEASPRDVLDTTHVASAHLAYQETYTDRDGRFEFRSLLPIVYELQSSGSADFGDFAPDREDLVLRLEHGACLTVRVLDAGGARPDVDLRVQKIETGPDGSWSPPYSWTYEHTKRQDAEGTWWIAFRRPGLRALVAEAPGEGLRADTVVDIRPGERGHLDLILAPREVLDWSELRTLDPHLADVPCDVRAWDPRTGSSVRAHAGVYLLPMTVALRPRPPSLALPATLLLPEEKPEDDEWISPGWGGRVRVSFDPPRRGGLVRLTLGDDDTLWIGERNRSVGRFANQNERSYSHPALPAGAYVLRVERRGEAPQEIDVELAARKVIDLTVRLP